MFIKANKEHLNYITQEAIEFIQEESSKYDIKNTMVSFSGGKDSTVVSDLVCKALPDKKIIHISMLGYKYNITTIYTPNIDLYNFK